MKMLAPSALALVPGSYKDSCPQQRRCEATVAIAKRMSVMDADYCARYASDSAIASCLTR